MDIARQVLCAGFHLHILDHCHLPRHSIPPRQAESSCGTNDIPPDDPYSSLTLSFASGFVDTILMSFIIGLSGALAPGPTLVATIQASMQRGWMAGPMVTLGHMLIESIVFLMIFAGVSTAIIGFSREIAVIGGFALVAFGAMTLRESRAGFSGAATEGTVTNPFLAGFVTGVSNPYFWIWWITVGGALLLSTLESGPVLAIAFMAGHWGADLGWYTLVSSGIHSGRNLLLLKGYRYVLLFCGIAMLFFGISFMAGGLF